MAALFEPHAVVDSGEGQMTLGRGAIRALFADITATGRKFESGNQSPAIINGDLALTSTRLPDGSVTAEVARPAGKPTGLGYGSSTSSPLRSALPLWPVPQLEIQTEELPAIRLWVRLKFRF